MTDTEVPTDSAYGPVHDILGVRVNAMTLEQTLDSIDRAIATRTPLHIGVVNAAKIVNMHRNDFLKNDVNSSDIVLADGAGVTLAAKVLKCPLPERVAGIDIMFGVFERGKERHHRVFCLGATEEISERVAQRLAEDYPGVVLAGRRNGYFSEAEEESVAKEIAASKADVLFVAMTSPKKEHFMAKWSDKMGVPVCHGVGGSFDVMSGKVERAPEVWQKYGMEWLYRVKQEPGRLWKRYLVTNVLFLWMLTKTRLKMLGKRKK